MRLQGIDKAALVKEVKQALYASKICSYAQGLNIIKAKSAEKDWGIDMGALSRIWKARCFACPPVVMQTEYALVKVSPVHLCKQVTSRYSQMVSCSP